MVLDGALVVSLGGVCGLGGVCAAATALTAKVASTSGRKYFFISSLLKKRGRQFIIAACKVYVRRRSPGLTVSACHQYLSEDVIDPVP